MNQLSKIHLEHSPAELEDFILSSQKEGMHRTQQFKEHIKIELYVHNHFDLGLFGEIAIVKGDEVIAALPDTRLAHIHYANECPRVDIAYSTECQNPHGGGAEYAALVRKIPKKFVAERDGQMLRLRGDVSVHVLFARLRQQVRDLAHRHLEWEGKNRQGNTSQDREKDPQIV